MSKNKVFLVTCSDNGDILGLCDNVKSLKQIISEYVENSYDKVFQFSKKNKITLDSDVTVVLGDNDKFIIFFVESMKINKLKL